MNTNKKDGDDSGDGDVILQLITFETQNTSKKEDNKKKEEDSSTNSKSVAKRRRIVMMMTMTQNPIESLAFMKSVMVIFLLQMSVPSN
jgi:hypothetical protein